MGKPDMSPSNTLLKHHYQLPVFYLLLVFCFKSTHFLRVHLTLPLSASLCFALSQLLPRATRVLRSDWTTPLLIPVAREPIPAQLLWLHVQSCSLPSKPESHGVQKHHGPCGRGAFGGQVARLWFTDWEKKRSKIKSEGKKSGPVASAREVGRLDFKVELFPKTVKVSRYLCDRQGKNVCRRGMNVNRAAESGSSRTRAYATQARIMAL